jgi:hypothetical protein
MITTQRASAQNAARCDAARCDAALRVAFFCVLPLLLAAAASKHC